MSRPLVILGTARKDGETRRAIDIAFPAGSIDFVDLGDHQIGNYNYAHTHADDEFLRIADRMLATDTIVFATPVYWYAMSATLKIFFDRLTDLLEIAKPKGRALAGKSVWLLATGIEEVLPEGFEIPFSRTADYFGMRYREAGYLYTGEDVEKREGSEKLLKDFGRKILVS